MYEEYIVSLNKYKNFKNVIITIKNKNPSTVCIFNVRTLHSTFTFVFFSTN